MTGQNLLYFTADNYTGFNPESIYHQSGSQLSTTYGYQFVSDENEDDDVEIIQFFSLHSLGVSYQIRNFAFEQANTFFALARGLHIRGCLHSMEL